MARRILPYVLALLVITAFAVIVSELTGKNAESRAAPEVSTGPATYAGAGSDARLLLSGAIDPGGLSTSYRFEYAPTKSGAAATGKPNAGGNPASTAPAEVSSDDHGKPVTVTASLRQLAPSATYRYRLVATNAEGTSKGSERTFRAPVACQGADGKCRWSVLDTSAIASDQVLRDVSCLRPSRCVGVTSQYTPKTSLAALWDGKNWKTIGQVPGALRAISCLTPTRCILAGDDPAGIWDFRQSNPASGSWRLKEEAPPLPRGSQRQELELNDVSCPSKAFCIVAGTYRAAVGLQNYVARWDGGKWAFQPAANPKPGPVVPSHGMIGVSCISADFCVTVGALDEKPFVENWDGRRWRMIPAPNPAGAYAASLNAVSCATPHACIAVGSHSREGAPDRPLVERWDGKTWAISDAPVPNSEGSGDLRGVSCVSPSSCIAVGSLSYQSSSESTETVAMTWDGTEWKIQPSPTPKAVSGFAAISCPSLVACMAVGLGRPPWAQLGASGLSLAERFG